jgi:hypothetical protein
VDDETAVGPALDRARLLQPFIVQNRESFETFAQAALKCGELRPHDEPLEHRAVFAVEGKRAPAKTVREARRRGRGAGRRKICRWCRHCRGRRHFCNPRTIGSISSHWPTILTNIRFFGEEWGLHRSARARS